MSEENFGLMDQAAKAMCESLENDPWRWREDPATLVDTKTGIEYWLGRSVGGAIVCTWNGYSASQVFSFQQGARIQNSFQEMRKIKASAAQSRVVRSFIEIREVEPEPGLIARLFSWLP